MKYRIHIFLISSALLLLLFGAFTSMEKLYATPVPEPSAKGGYYENSFVLKFDAPNNGTIYYTTDGSIPTTNSLVYDDGILIEDRSAQPNRINAVQNIVVKSENDAKAAS